MDCPICESEMENSEIKFGWHDYYCSDCDHHVESSPMDDEMEAASHGRWSDRAYQRLIDDLQAKNTPL